jgi:hypothetical protein
MDTDKQDVPYTVAYCYDNVGGRSYYDFMNLLTTYTAGEDDIIFSKKCYNEDPKGDSRYMVVIKKNVNDDLAKNENLLGDGIVIKRFRPKVQRLRENAEYGFHIKTDKISSADVVSLFKHLEDKNFIRNGSYKVLYPQPYPDGKARDYLIITFGENGGVAPKGFVGKLRSLLNDTPMGEHYLRLNWVQKSVLNDIIQKKEKELRKPQVSVEPQASVEPRLALAH